MLVRNINTNLHFLLRCVFLTTLAARVDSAQHVGVARAVPATHVALNDTPTSVISGVSRIHCLKECLRSNCSAFNFGDRQCELLDKYLCEDIEVLTPRTKYRYFDVATDEFLLIVDDYRTVPACLISNRCSPKCHFPKTTSASTTPTPSTTTTTAATTSTTTPTPTTTRPTPTPTTTTPTPTSTTTATTTSTTTTTLTPTTTTTTVATSTVAPFGPGDVGWVCSTNGDCSTPNSDCRNSDVCTCIAGYSHHPATKSCVTTCPSGYGTTFSKTTMAYISGHDIADFEFTSLDDCKAHCLATPGCVSIDEGWALTSCSLSDVTKNDIDVLLEWVIDNSFFNYYQRDCD